MIAGYIQAAAARRRAVEQRIRHDQLPSSWAPRGHYPPDSQTTSEEFPTTPLQSPSEPPPLGRHSPYCRVPLPEIPHEVGELHPILAYADGSQASEHNIARIPLPYGRHYQFAPATTPSKGSMIIIFPGMGPITVRASRANPTTVTVGDVLAVIDRALFGTVGGGYSRFSHHPEAGDSIRRSHAKGSARSEESTVLGYLRGQFQRAGLSRSALGLDIWVLHIG